MNQTKHILRPLLMAIVMLVGMLVPQGAWAAEVVTIDGITFLYDVEGDGITIYGYDNGDATYVEVPEKINGTPVTKINEFAFTGKSNLSVVVLPASITTLGGYIFEGTNNLVAIEFKGENPPADINESAFDHFDESNLSIVVPEGRLEAYQEALEKWFAPEKFVTKMPDLPMIKDDIEYRITDADSKYVSLFKGSAASGDITIPATIPDDKGVEYTVTEVAGSAFDSNEDLTSVTIPGTVQTIGNWAFFGCSNLATVTLSEGVHALGTNAFRNTALTSLVLPASLTSIDLDAFSGCNYLGYMVFKGNKPTLHTQGFLLNRTAPITLYVKDLSQWNTTDKLGAKDECEVTYKSLSDYCSDVHGAHNYIGGVCQNCGEYETQGPIIMTCLAGTSGIGFGEGAASLIDGDDDTKWCSNWYADNKPYIIFKTNVPAKLTGYNMVHGNDTPDYPGRAWATWTIYGANFDSDSQATAESTAWKEVDKHSGYSFDSDYSFSNLTNLQYQYYKIVVDEVPNNSLQQMAEIHFTFFACNHKGTFTEHPATEATAEAHGNAAYKTCDICGACLDADGQEITTSVIHYFDDEHTHAAKDPSCTQVGNIAYKECAVCQAIFDMDGNPIDSYEVPMSDHSYDSEGKCTTCGQELPLLSLGSNTIDIEEGYTIFYFIAPQDATYIFETVGDEDTYGAIPSTDGETIIAEDDDSGDGRNFRLSYEMSAGSIVTLSVTQYAYNAIPGYTLVIRIHNHEWRDGVCAECYKICDHSDMEKLGHSDATCTQPAGTSYKCNICSFTEFTPDPESSALGHNVVDGVCTRCEKSMAVAVTIGSDTHQFIDFDEALPVALDVLSATVTLLTDVTLPKDKELFFDRGNITLDLNGKKISGNGIRIVYLLRGNLTITDNTADKKGVIENTTNGGDVISSAVVWVDLGALVIHAGTFCSKSELALYANQHNQEFINVTIDGGRFVSLEGGAAISTVYKSSLAEGYAYYKTGTCEEIEEQLDTPISESDIIVLPMSIKAHDFTSKTLTAEPDEHGLYAYVCDHGCGAHGDYNVVKGNGEGNNIELIATTDSETGITTYSAESVFIEDGKPFYSPVEFTTTDVDMGRQFTQSVGGAVVPATIMLPFRMEAGEVSTVNPQGVRTGTKFYSFTSLDYNSANDRWEANMDIVIDDLEAYTPYMVVLTDGEEIPFGNAPVTFPATPAENYNTTQGDWSFVATNEAKVWTAADFGNGQAYYGFAAGNEITPEGKFVKVGVDASIAPLRAYLMKNVPAGGASNAPAHAMAASQMPSTIGVRFNDEEATGIGTLNTETGEFTFHGWYDLQGRRISEPVKGGISIRNGKKVMHSY